MTESDLEKQLKSEGRRHGSKLDPYRDFIVRELTEAPFLSCPQILDHLKEHHPDMPYVSDRCVYNYVTRMRQTENLPKNSDRIRQMSKVPDCEYGEQAQVDYGEQWMRDSDGRMVKVYFFAMVLRRSRYKFIYLQNVPFTAMSTVYAHHLAFVYFGGMPRKVVYDQDRKIIVNENFGDYMMTAEMASYVASAGFEPVFCMTADPQSKGAIENVVKYVKGNFLKGRVYTTIESLNEQAVGWLERTGNGRPHATTGLVPAVEFIKEKAVLRPYLLTMSKPASEARRYNVRKDNTVLYRGNTYALPLGTYKGPGTKILLVPDPDKDRISLHDEEFKHITSHQICHLKGQFITREGLATTRTPEMLEAEKTLRTHLGQWDGGSPLSRLLSAIREDRPRYYSKTVRAMAVSLTRFQASEACALIDIYIDKKVYNAAVMEEVACATFSDKPQAKAQTPAPTAHPQSPEMTPQTRPISEYESIIDGKEADHGNR